MRIKLALAIFCSSLLALHLACQSDPEAPPPGPTPISAGTWTWISGGNTVRQPGVYGIKGVSDPSNVPRARDSAVSWIDANGKFWIFGGSWNWVLSYTYYNDLWNYDLTTGEWTWVSGSDVDGQFGDGVATRGTADPSNVPGARRSAASWRDLQGNLWLFGGYGRDWANYNGELNDLWKLDPATPFEWAWMCEAKTSISRPSMVQKASLIPSNIPGARAKSASWVDRSGRFWLFGGIEKAVYTSNDLWMYDLATFDWTWVAGGNTGFQKGVYGIKKDKPTQ
ncbi:MAG: kelch motif-containing protein [Comamonadaceae bacterium]|nr:kelch motif-containing protein [Comamonadaceae bacterium]